MNLTQLSVLFGLGAAIFMVSPAQATEIRDITLFNSQNPNQIWVTTDTSRWILGVSNSDSGPILNSPNGSVSGIPQGDYWLFANPANLGALPQLNVTFSDGSSVSALFQVVGENGSGQSWTRLSGSNQLDLGWAVGAADLVGTWGGVLPDGVSDFYMKATIGTNSNVPAVPEPSSLFLYGFGLLGLIGVKKRLTSKAGA